jgi:hypothetical protein
LIPLGSQPLTEKLMVAQLGMRTLLACLIFASLSGLGKLEDEGAGKATCVFWSSS